MASSRVRRPHFTAARISEMGLPDGSNTSSVRTDKAEMDSSTVRGNRRRILDGSSAVTEMAAPVAMACTLAATVLDHGQVPEPLQALPAQVAQTASTTGRQESSRSRLKRSESILPQQEQEQETREPTRSTKVRECPILRWHAKPVTSETGKEEGPRERGCTGAHPTDGARLSRRWHTEGEQRAWDRSRRSRTYNICCPARHLRITLVVPCVKYRSWVRLRQDVLEEATPLVHPERSRPSSKNRASSRSSSGSGTA